LSKPVSPEFIFETIHGYQRTAAIKGGIDLDLFTAIGEGNNTAEAIAKRCNASERGIRILADFLVVSRLLTKSVSAYGLTPEAAAFLDRRSPAYMGSVTQFLLAPSQLEQFKDVAETVRKGGATAGAGAIETDHPMWIDFARSMTPMMMPAAQAIAELVGASKGEKWKVLDVAAGHGVLGIAIAQHNPNAEIVALDWPNVLQVAQENAEKSGVAARFRKLPGDAMTVEYGSGYDIVLITNFLHHFDAAGCEALLRKVHGALKPRGRAVTLEFVPNDDRVTPPMPASFSFMMLNLTPAGDAHTFAELERMFKNAGFSRSEPHPLQVSPETVIVSYA
jgi:2-polyprenyl-3-methyl-5-hydroxy-6-metoxy-1,4-benzoquinol methylase